MNEIERRLYGSAQGRRDLQRDFDLAQAELRLAHKNFTDSKTAHKGTPSAASQERYARALRELDIASRCLALVRAEAS